MSQPPTTPILPLDDVTVIELDNWMAAPSAGAILADMGATVIKVEPLRGDPMRNGGRKPKLPENTPQADYDYQFDAANRGKKSIAVDIASEEGAALVLRLCENADVFMCNLLVHRQAKFGLDPESLLAVNPRIVHATLTGYGTEGPEAWRPGYDVTAFFARSGLYHMMREGEEGVPPMARTAQGDYTTGLALTGAILGALRLAERSGIGQVVESSLYETAVWTQASDYAVTTADNAALRPRARENQILATANRYRCGDGKWLVFNMPLPSAWPLLCEAIGLDDWITDERFIDLRARFRNMPEIVAGIDEALSTRSRDEWGALFDKAGIVWGPVLGLDEVLADPHAEALNMFPTLTAEGVGEYKTIANPMKFRSAPVGPQGPHPKLGEHTRSVLAGAGLTDTDIDALYEANTIG